MTTVGDLPLGTRLILVAEDLLSQFGTRTENGDALTAEWGEPTPEGWYEPTFFAHHDNNLIVTERERIRAAVDVVRGWLANPEWPIFGPGIIADGPFDAGRMAARAAAQQVIDAIENPR